MALALAAPDADATRVRQTADMAAMSHGVFLQLESERLIARYANAGLFVYGA